MSDPKLGINWMSYHLASHHFDHVRAMGYRAILVYEWMWRDKDFCDRLVAAAPADCIFIARDHPLSEQKEDMYRDPVGTGMRHGKEWLRKVDEKQVHLPLKRTWFQGINEPDSNHHYEAIDLYTEAMVRTLGERGGKTAGWCFGVGHPSTVDRKPDGPVDWSHYAKSAAALAKYGGLADFHAYAVPHSFSLKDHLGRIATCPYKLPAVVSEFGIDWGIVEGHPVMGWAKTLNGQEYVEWVDEAQSQFYGWLAAHNCPLDIKALCIFSFDSNSDWKTFDIREIAGLFEGRKWKEPASFPSQKPEGDPFVISMPFVSYQGGVMNDEKWQRSAKILIDRFEGGLSLDPNDIGNWYNGQLIGTKYGISARSWAHLYDIPSLTREQAEKIYYEHYWLASGADKQPWPTCYLHFDSAVNMGLGAAQRFAEEARGNPWLYMAARQRYYVNASTWEHHGKGWMNRNAGVMEILAELWET